MSEWLSPAEAGAILGVGPDRVAQLAREGTLTSMHTPGGHVRVRRTDVEQLAAPIEELPLPQARTRAPESGTTPRDPGPPSKPKWEDVAPWQRRVREAEADIRVLRLDDERDRLVGERSDREAGRKQAERRHAARAVEDDEGARRVAAVTVRS